MTRQMLKHTRGWLFISLARTISPLEALLVRATKLVIHAIVQGIALRNALRGGEHGAIASWKGRSCCLVASDWVERLRLLFVFRTPTSRRPWSECLGASADDAYE